jgi:NAD(P) transhydrogenase subunit alpha
MLMTAAGTGRAGQVLVLGAGVCRACRRSRRAPLGAVVTGFDVRPVVKEQVESLGATFLELSVRGEETRAVREGAHARAAGAAAAGARERISGVRRRRHDRRSSPAGRRRAHPASAVEAMRPGSVIVDLASRRRQLRADDAGRDHGRARRDDRRPDEPPSTMPYHASQLYSRNVSALSCTSRRRAS